MTKLEQAARQAFETWWEREGQEFLYALNTTTDDDIKLVAEVAWKNGAYCAEQAEQSQLADASLEPVATMEVFSGWWGKEANFEQLNYDLPDGFYKLYAAPVRTKDLTDEEICRMWNDWHDVVGAGEFALITRAVIAADREKNK